MTSLLLLGLLLLGTAAPASATGNCGEGWLVLYQDANSGGGSRTYCFGVDDIDIESESGNVMGPLSDGSFKNDFDNIASQSGVSSYALSDNAGGQDIKVCLYLV